ncbi:hypothetical protein N2152v2_001243 [Parachlorella kessleri]
MELTEQLGKCAGQLYNVTNYVRITGVGARPFSQQKQALLLKSFSRNIPLHPQASILAYKESNVTATQADAQQGSTPTVDVVFERDGIGMLTPRLPVCPRAPLSQLLMRSPVRLPVQLPAGDPKTLHGFEVLIQQTLAVAGFNVTAKLLYDRVMGPLPDEPAGQYMILGLNGSEAFTLDTNSTRDTLAEVLDETFSAQGLECEVAKFLPVAPLGTSQSAGTQQTAPALLLLRAWQNSSVSPFNNALPKEVVKASAQALAAVLANATLPALEDAEETLRQEGVQGRLTLLNLIPYGGYPRVANLTSAAAQRTTAGNASEASPDWQPHRVPTKPPGLQMPRQSLQRKAWGESPLTVDVVYLLQLSGLRLSPFSALKQALLVGYINAAYPPESEVTILAVEEEPFLPKAPAAPAAPPPTVGGSTTSNPAPANTSASLPGPPTVPPAGGRRLLQQAQQPPVGPSTASPLPAGSPSPTPLAGPVPAAPAGNDTVRVLVRAVMLEGGMPGMTWDTEAAVAQGMGLAGFPLTATVLDRQSYFSIPADPSNATAQPGNSTTAPSPNRRPALVPLPPTNDSPVNLTDSTGGLPEVDSAVPNPNNTVVAAAASPAPAATSSSPTSSFTPAEGPSPPTNSSSAGGPAAPPAPVAAPADPAGVATIDSSGGSSTSMSTGSIVGVAVGAAAAAGVLAVVAAFVYRTRHSRAQGDGGTYSGLHPTASAMLSTGGALSMSVTSKDIEMSLQEPFSPKHGVAPSVPAPPRLGAFKGGYQVLSTMTKDQAVDRILGQLRGRAMRLQTLDSAPDPVASYVAQYMQPGSRYADKYTVEGVCVEGGSNVLSLAHDDGNNIKVAIKCYASATDFHNEHDFYASQFSVSATGEAVVPRRLSVQPESACRVLPVLCDALMNSAGTAAACQACGTAIPPAIVLERGSFTLQAWLSGGGQEVLPLNEAARIDCLYGICKALEYLHSQGFVHGDVTPAHIMYFDGERAWKLLGLSGVTRHGSARPEGHRPATLRYAAPELLLAELQEGTSATHAVERASDMWSLGVLAFEVLTGRQLFDAESYADEDVVETLLGYRRLPYESDPSFLGSLGLQQAAARSLITDLTRRTPAARKPIRSVVQSPLFTRRSLLGERGRGLATMLGSITGPFTTMYGTSPLSRKG